MRFRLPKVLLSVLLCVVGAAAQTEFDGRSFDGIKQDFRAVGAVVRVKIKNVRFAAKGAHFLYAAESEVVETFKGKIKKGALTFYLGAEEDYDVKQLIGKDLIIFLEKQNPVPTGGKAWYELENSQIDFSNKLAEKLRKLKK